MGMMKKLLFVFLLYCGVALCNPIDDQCNKHVIWGAPQIIKEGNNQYLCHQGYAANYSYSNKVSYFVVETIEPGTLNGQESRENDFREDTTIPKSFRSTLKDYDHSGYDRGHMAPAGDFTYSKEVMSDSFLLSNMMPQAPMNNRGIWKDLEEKVRGWGSHKKLYIISGTIFEDQKFIGNHVRVPTKIYKIIVDPKGKMIAFMFPNEKLDPKEMDKYIVSVAEITAKTNINYFPKLPQPMITMVSQRSTLKDWP